MRCLRLWREHVLEQKNTRLGEFWHARKRRTMSSFRENMPTEVEVQAGRVEWWADRRARDVVRSIWYHRFLPDFFLPKMNGHYRLVDATQDEVYLSRARVRSCSAPFLVAV